MGTVINREVDNITVITEVGETYGLHELKMGCPTSIIFYTTKIIGTSKEFSSGGYRVLRTIRRLYMTFKHINTAN